jgi:hypothetical protein
MTRHRRRLLQMLSMLEMVMLLLVQSLMMSKIVGESLLDMLARRTMNLRGSLDLGIQRLVKAAELELLLVDGIQQRLRLLGASGC